jgi:hypothetical protein
LARVSVTVRCTPEDAQSAESARARCRGRPRSPSRRQPKRQLLQTRRRLSARRTRLRRRHEAVTSSTTPARLGATVSDIRSHANAPGGKCCAITKAGLAASDSRDPVFATSRAAVADGATPLLPEPRWALPTNSPQDRRRPLRRPRLAYVPIPLLREGLYQRRALRGARASGDEHWCWAGVDLRLRWRRLPGLKSRMPLPCCALATVGAAGTIGSR